MREFIFFVSQPKRLRAGGWQFEVASLRLRVHGPFSSQAEASRARRVLQDRWRARAVGLGGSFRLDRSTEWIVAVPDGTPVDGIPWTEETPDDRKTRDPRDDPPLKLRGGAWKIR